MQQYSEMIEKAIYDGYAKDSAYITKIINEAWNCGRFDELLYCDNFEVRETLAISGFALDVLIYDEHWRVRQAVAKKGYGLDILIKDRNILVRRIAQEAFL